MGKNTETNGRNKPWKQILGGGKIQSSILGPNTLPESGSTMQVKKVTAKMKPV